MAVTGVNPVTSVGFGCADRWPAAPQLSALLRRRVASASLRAGVAHRRIDPGRTPVHRLNALEKDARSEKPTR